MAKYFFDTEFHTGEKTTFFLDFISIGLVGDDGREFYAVSNEFDLDRVWRWHGGWVKDNVLKRIFDDFEDDGLKFNKWSFQRRLEKFGESREQIAGRLREFLGYTGPGLLEPPAEELEFYAYYAAYDWVMLTSLEGGFERLPAGFPFFCFDLKQKMAEWGLSKEWQETRLPAPDDEHHALADARWNKQLYHEIYSPNFLITGYPGWPGKPGLTKPAS